MAAANNSGRAERGLYSDFADALASAKAVSGPVAAGEQASRKRPLAHTFRARRASGEIGTALHAAAANDDIFQTPAVKKSLEPKVFVPHQRNDGGPPRRIEVERRKRYFASQDVGALLAADGVTVGMLAGEPTPLPDTLAGLQSLAHLLPLEAFDNTEFEDRTPEEWLTLDQHTPQPAVPARAWHGATRAWRPVMVRAWDAANDMWRVEWMPEDAASAWSSSFASTGAGESKAARDESKSSAEQTAEREASGGEGTAEPGSVSTLHRLHLCFLAEDPFKFSKRVAAAFAAREQAERRLRLALYIDCMPMDGVPGLSPEQLSRIQATATAAPRLAAVGANATALLNEANKDFRWTQNKVAFDAVVRAAAAEGPAAAGGPAAELGLLALVPMPPAGSNASASSQAAQGCVPTPAHNFAEAFSNFSFHTHYTLRPIIAALQRVRGECLRLRSESLLVTAPSKPQRLDEFLHVNSSASAAFRSYMNDTWMANTKTALRHHLGGLGKGWYQLKVTDRESYEYSRLRDLLCMVNFMMADDLRSTVQGVLQKFCSFIESAAEGSVDVRSTADVRLDYTQCYSDPVEQSARVRRPPLFAVRLVVREEELPLSDDAEGDQQNSAKPPTRAGKGKRAAAARPTRRFFAYDTELDELLSAPGKALETAVSQLAGIVTVERRVMDRLFWSHEPHLPAPHLSEQWIQDLRERVAAAAERARQPLNAFLELFRVHETFLNLDADVTLESLRAEAAEKFSLSKLVDLATEHERAASTAHSDIAASQSLGFVAVHGEDVASLLAHKHASIGEQVWGVVAEHATAVSAEVVADCKAIDKALSVYPRDIEQLAEVREFMQGVPDKLKELQVKNDSNAAVYAALDEARIQLPRPQFDVRWQAVSSPMSVMDRMASVAEMLDTEAARYQEEMETEQVEFQEELNSLHGEVLNLNTFTDIDAVHAVAAHVNKLKKRMEAARAQADLFNNREGLFGKDLTEYDRIAEISKAFDPYYLLWDTAAKWVTWQEEWTGDPFLSLDAELVERSTLTAARTFFRATKNFEKLGVSSCLNIAKNLHAQVEEFKPSLPLIIALRNPGMRERHWEALSDTVSFKVAPDDAFTLRTVWELNLAEHVESITKIGESAGKEYQIEQALSKMAGEWADILLEIEPYRSTGTFILKGLEDLQALLDEHITMTSAMAFSAFKKPFEKEIDDWTATLNCVSDVLEEWIKVQRAWLYLQPIFDSADIQKQLPKEYKRFSAVDKNWRTTMSNARSSPGAIKFCNNPKLLEKFQESNTFLELVQKQLSDYLETKRAAFSRFYFLSNDELLDILSSTKDPRAVQPHLKKCFEGLNRVVFNDDTVIVQFASEEGEHIDVVNGGVDPKGKNVEVWMNELELAMVASVQSVMWQSVAAYTETPRVDWMQAWPAQCIINASQLHWTREIEEGMADNGAAGVAAAYERQLAQLQDMVRLVRKPLEKLIRIQLGALAVIDVHARDVTKKLVASKVAVPNDFEWACQMRYYWTEGGADGNMRVQMLTSNQAYGYEYVGNTPRLVITPLTDKCYLTLMGAIAMNLGGAPAGPAGTGKTETTKDLAKALAVPCVVFNCSDQMDVIMLAKFFKGLASCGAWACFDEFNRIDIEVLSVVAQQLLTLQSAVNRGEPRCFFVDSEIRVNGRFATFITMNPGYAGRTELPDNLKALFRPVAMMVPDYALIGEIMLFSYGFDHALSCARKMVATFRLCSEQLSSQDHYDYGMRAVKTVITAAGNLKRADPGMNEDQLLYRALQDVNLPKFLEHDLPLFRGIMSDLFPGINRPQIDYNDLQQALTYAAEQAGLQPVPTFMTKCVQLYETVIVRHGLMVVGPTGAGKSRVISTLRDALSALARAQVQGPKIAPVHTHYVNPKSVTMGQLYGEFDENTHEWRDGVLADMVRTCADAGTDDLQWVVFDGPVDAIWIENMNTVLDDNKKLCLVSGEIIKLSSPMTIMFEPEDLAVASPATVSRCGMVYMEPSALGWDPLLQSWLESLPAGLPPSVAASVALLADTYVAPALYMLRRFLTEPVPTRNNSLVRGLLNLLDCFLEPWVPRESRDAPSAEITERLAAQLPALFMFSLVWSIGATVDGPGRARFSTWLRSTMAAHGAAHPFPVEGSVYDWAWHQETGAWVSWMDTVPAYEWPKAASFSELLIPTKDSVRYKWLGSTLLQNRKFVLMTGPTGTGKTVNMMEMLSKDMPKQFVPLTLTFSAQTSANQTQDIVDSKMEKRARGTFGPTVGTYYVLFVDDLNMPQREEYFAQPPIELLRQWCDYGGWYDRKERTFRRIVDTVLLAAMGPPGGGRNPITGRMVRHLHVVNYAPMDDESMGRIFGSILGHFLDSPAVEAAVQELAPGVTQAAIQVYNTICDALLPTPAKPHYTFNLRDLGKVFQGMLMVEAKKLADPAALIRLWVHESRRVFADRLINAEDRGWFDDQLRAGMGAHLPLSWDDLSMPQRLLFGDFMSTADPRPYEEVAQPDQVLPTVEEFLGNYNAESKTPMKLVLFMDAVEHVARIARVLRQPQGHALLLGVGGSGRQSLARLATFIAEYSLFQVEISKGYGKTEWREDLKSVLMKAGVKQEPVVFLFTDTQVVFEGMVEDINNILNSGDVPNLYTTEDMDIIRNACRRECLARRLAPTKINIFAQYLVRVRSNIHVVLAMSPMGDAFRNRLRMFPALVNCCTIDWFSAWPDEALRSVARDTLVEADLGLGEHTDSCVEFFRSVHQGVATASAEYFEQLRRYNYVTPTSYLELLSTFKAVLVEKRGEVGTLRSRLQVGLDKMKSTAEVVANLQEELTAMQPQLVATQAEVDDLIVAIDKDKAVAAETQKACSAEEEDAQKKAAETKAIADDAQADLDKALPALEAAVKCLADLKRSDIDELRAIKVASEGVVLVMQAACVMFGVRPVMKADPDNPGKKKRDYWEAAKTNLLKDAAKLLRDLVEFDKDSISDNVVAAIAPFMEDPRFTPEIVAKSSKACSGICMWVRAMYTYNTIAKQVEPKKQRLAEAQSDLDETMAKLAEARAQLKSVEDKLAELEAKFDAANQRKLDLQTQVEQCQARLERAHKLIGGLGGEKDRWTSTVARLNKDFTALIGDALVASSTIAYLGAFTSDFRHRLVAAWQDALKQACIPHTPGTDLRSTLADPVRVRAWNIAALPADAHSVENGIIMWKARRWPLLIDPQGQANRFIKNMGRDKENAPNGMDIVRLSDKKFLQSLENGVRFGKWILLENIGESLEATLEPVLLQQTFKQGGALMIKLGDSVVPYNDDFRFFMTTKLPNPHYPPEVAVKVSLLNFTITPRGLEDQMLGVFVVTEMPELEERKNTLTLENARMKRELAETEDKILYLLSNSSGNILDDVELIDTLARSKVTSEDIKTQVAAAEETEREIDATREKYRPVAYRASLLYFAVTDLAGVDPMYQYSLPWFTSLFVNAVRNSQPSDEVPVRIQTLNDFFTLLLYRAVCRSLFERHKLMFSFLLTSRIMGGDGRLDAAEWHYLLTGTNAAASASPENTPNPAPEWVTPRMWSDLCALSGLPFFSGVLEHWASDVAGMKAIFDAAEAQEAALPTRYADATPVQKLCLLRALRPDKCMLAVQAFVEGELGRNFIEPPPFDLAACYEDASVVTPLIFVLSPGSDPTKAFYNFAESMGMRDRVFGISLGQGQGPKAAALVERAQTEGGWVLLQNCHLATSWMPSLERLVEGIDPDHVSSDFRLWLTSAPSPAFPVTVLQNGVKMTNEPPKGLRANLRNFFYSQNDESLSITRSPMAYRKLLFGLAFFHAIVQERKKFGPLGWNKPYEFNDSDLEISQRQTALYIDEYDEIPYRVLNFLTSYINYGGRVTDSTDLRTIDIILRDYFCEDIQEDGYAFSPSGVYYSPPIAEDTPHAAIMEYVDTLPLNPDPEVFGMHANANITCDLTETDTTFAILASLAPRSGAGAGASAESLLMVQASDILEKLPALYDIEAVSMQYPVRYEESMNTVLVQECIRYNRLLAAMHDSLPELCRALKGEVVMSSELEDMANAMTAGRVPAAWEARAYPSLKPLAAWVTELMDRLTFISSWVADGKPNVYWISGFFFPQAFLTGTLQNYARAQSMPIDTVNFNFKLLDVEPDTLTSAPESGGAYIHGLWLEGARWNAERKVLDDPLPKQLFVALPPMELEPQQHRSAPTKNVYRCPVYKVLSRFGKLATTGHSSNFVMFIELPSDTGHCVNNVGLADSATWIKAGVAAFCALKF